VLSRRGMRALGKLNEGEGMGGPSINITVNGVVGDEREVARRILSYITEEMRGRGVKLAGVAA
jgi:hypothetical protein